MELFEFYKKIEEYQNQKNNILATVIEGENSGSRYFFSEGELIAAYGDGASPDEQLKELGLITEKGEYVRSKSEKIIADTLTKNNINYVYELPLRLKGYGTVKPDFTVLNKRTRHEYVWEHFGMMDDSIYVKNAIKKIEQYGKSGYVQGRNFIATFESKEAPLNTVTINRAIQDFFQ